MYKDYRYINAGENEVYRWGWKARQKANQCLTPNVKGFYTIPADGGKYWSIGTSESRYGFFASFGDKILPVNSYGYVWAKVGTEKEETFKAMVNSLIKSMERNLKSSNKEEKEQDNE